MLAVLAPLVGLLVLSTVSVYLQPKFIVNWISQAYPEVVFSVNTTKMIIALTIDDAPTRLETPIILDILRDNDVRATFFCIGYNIITEDGDREILSRMIREGHELGNHMSFDAPSYQLNETEFNKQFMEVDEMLEEARNKTAPPDNTNDSKWFRPGHGFFTRKMVQNVSTYGYKTALGDVYPHDPAIAISSINAYCIFNYCGVASLAHIFSNYFPLTPIYTLHMRPSLRSTHHSLLSFY
jgi:peptidoglycan/xylan/chitin deacetylase (PgdA/CDA1 family)